MSRRFIRSQSALLVQICGIAIAITMVVLAFVRERAAERHALGDRVERIVLNANYRVTAALLAVGEHQPWQQGATEPAFCELAKTIEINYPFVIALLQHGHDNQSALTDAGSLPCGVPHPMQALAFPLWVNSARPLATQVQTVSESLKQRMQNVARTTPLPAIASLDVPELGAAGPMLALLAPRRAIDGSARGGITSALVDPIAVVTEARDAMTEMSRLEGSITLRPADAKTKGALILPPIWCLLSCTNYSAIRDISWGNRHWTMELSQTAPSLLDRYGGSISIALLGLILSTLWVLHVRHAQSAAWQVAIMVERRESELQALNEILIEDIERRKRTMDELTRSRARLRQLTEHNARIKEEERTRIAREIHDDLGQSMMVLRIDLSLIADSEVNPARRAHIQQALAQIDQTVTAMRLIINELRPAVLDLGLDAAIEWESRKFSRRSAIACTLDLRISGAALSDELTTAFYRITQESLTNIMRHSQAKSASIRLWIDQEWLFMNISDDGIGMEEDSRPGSVSFGLIGIAERAFALGGAFDLDSAPGKGTHMLIGAPLVQPCVLHGQGDPCVPDRGKQ